MQQTSPFGSASKSIASQKQIQIHVKNVLGDEAPPNFDFKIYYEQIKEKLIKKDKESAVAIIDTVIATQPVQIETFSSQPLMKKNPPVKRTLKKFKATEITSIETAVTDNDVFNPPDKMEFDLEPKNHDEVIKGISTPNAHSSHGETQQCMHHDFKPNSQAIAQCPSTYHKLQKPILIGSRRKISKITNCPHVHKKHYAKGMCNYCYHMFGRNNKASYCKHTNRQVYAKGLCHKCYNALYYKRCKDEINGEDMDEQRQLEIQQSILDRVDEEPSQQKFLQSQQQPLQLMTVQGNKMVIDPSQFTLIQQILGEIQQKEQK